ncbi:MAG: S9 family peptidase, partial [Streptosporangiaceae bacterium]
MIPEEPARAAGPELTAEMVADSATASAPAISPDGHWVAYLVTTASGAGQGPASTLWIAATDGSEPPRPLTAGPAQAPRWTPDADAISYLAGGQLCLIRPDGSGEVTLTSWKPAITAHLPLGPLIAVVARDRELGGDPEVWSEPGRVNRLWQLEPGRAGLEPVAGLGDRHVVEIAARPDGEALAVISWDRPEDEPGAFTARLHIADLSTGQVRDLGPAGLDARSPVWWPAKDGWHVAYLAITPPGPVGGDAIFDVPPEGPHRNLTAGLDVCPAELVQVPGKPPLALFADGLDTAVYQLDPGRGRFGRLRIWTGRADSLTVSGSGEPIALR